MKKLFCWGFVCLFAVVLQIGFAHEVNLGPVVAENGKWGFSDEIGHLLIAPQFDEAHDFHEGRAAVKFDGKWGFINRLGITAIEPKYTDVSDFHHGTALALGDSPQNLMKINSNGASREATSQELQAYQRLQRIGVNLNVVNQLLTEGLHSAHQIAAISQTHFIASSRMGVQGSVLPPKSPNGVSLSQPLLREYKNSQTKIVHLIAMHQDLLNHHSGAYRRKKEMVISRLTRELAHTVALSDSANHVEAIKRLAAVHQALQEEIDTRSRK